MTSWRTDSRLYEAPASHPQAHTGMRAGSAKTKPVKLPHPEKMQKTCDGFWLWLSPPAFPPPQHEPSGPRLACGSQSSCYRRAKHPWPLQSTIGCDWDLHQRRILPQDVALGATSKLSVFLCFKLVASIPPTAVIRRTSTVRKAVKRSQKVITTTSLRPWNVESGIFMAKRAVRRWCGT